MTDAPRAQVPARVTALTPERITISYAKPQDQSGSGWFGPGQPMTPLAPEEVAGRTFDFPQSFNLLQRPRTFEIGFDQLRGFADGYDLARIIIETRKDQMARQLWDIVPREKGATSKDPKTVERIAAAKAFFRKPDKVNYWHDWLRTLLEDLLVIDAVSIYKRRNLDGSLFALQPIDGATIKRVIDDHGNTPLAPAPAYQQVLHGMPAVDYSTAELVYAPRNVRAHKVYGFSPIEQVVMTISIALKRQISQLQYFTEGSLPDALIGVPSTWTPEQIRAFQTWFNSVLFGDTGARRGALFVPGEVAKGLVQTKEVNLFGQAEEWMARVICYAFGVSPTPLVSQVNRATAESAIWEAISDGLAPIQVWVKGLIDRVLEEEFGSDDLEFEWIDDDIQDPLEKAKVLELQVKTGIMTINEARAQLSLTAIKDPRFDTPMAFAPASGFLDVTGAPPLKETEALLPGDEDPNAQPKPPPAPPASTPPSPEAPAPADVDSDDAADTGSNASAKAAKRKKVIKWKPLCKAVADTSPLIRTATKSVSKTVKGQFDKARAAVADQLKVKLAGVVADPEKIKFKDPTHRALFASVVKADEDEPEIDPDQLADDLDLSSLDTLYDEVSPELFDVHGESALKAIAQVGGSTEAGAADAIVNRVNERAVDWAKGRAAGLANVSDSTRELLRTTITNGLANNDGGDAIISAIEDGFAFSEERATTIARTEISAANNHGALAGYHEAKAQGVAMMKAWSTAQDELVDEDICQGNEDEGPIELDDTFQSGDDAPPGHPNCRCSLVPVVSDGEGDEGGGDAASDEGDDSGEE